MTAVSIDRRYSPLATAGIAAALLCANPCGAGEAPGRLAQPRSPIQSAVIENTDISTGEFWEAFSSADPVQRARAEWFLVGVLDATEGVSWCDYRRYKTITIGEAIYDELQRTAAQRHGERAATTIAHVLAKNFACGKKQ